MCSVCRDPGREEYSIDGADEGSATSTRYASTSEPDNPQYCGFTAQEYFDKLWANGWPPRRLPTGRTATVTGFRTSSRRTPIRTPYDRQRSWYVASAGAPGRIGHSRV